MVFGWSPEIGDPTIWGWLTVINYFLAFVISARAARVDWKNANFWAFISLAMLVLCVNKQLDLQSLLTAMGRELSERGGWYEDRRIVQRIFIEAVALVAIAGMSALIFINRRAGKPIIGAVVGMTFIGAFVVARAASFHGMDQMLGLSIMALKLNHILENVGIAMVLGSASCAVSSSKKRLQPPRN